MKDVITVILSYIFSVYREVIIAITVSAFVVFFIPWLKKRASRGSGFHLYRLTITDTETGCWYTIGLFSGKDQAKECSEHYLNEVPGFKDKKCKTDIDEVQIFTYMGRENDFLYQIVGWNETSDGEVKDIYSLYFFTKEECIGELENIITSKNKRSQWRIVRFEVGKRYYPEGFENRE